MCNVQSIVQQALWIDLCVSATAQQGQAKAMTDARIKAFGDALYSQRTLGAERTVQAGAGDSFSVRIHFL